jgi:hypothetical protein
MSSGITFLFVYLCFMVWLIVVGVLISLLCWFLFSPLVMKIDTRIPWAVLQWISIGSMRIWYEDEWWLNMRILFYHKTMRLSEIRIKPKKRKDTTEEKKSTRKMKLSRLLKKMIRVIKTFRVTEWQLAIDTGDYTRDAQLYPLNFLPYTFQHLHINFFEENYLVLKIRNRPWKILYAFLR